MRVHELRTVDGYIAFDLDDSRVNAGGTRYAADVDRAEAELLARAMTYKFACLGQRVGGAKGVLRGSAEERDEVLARYCAEIAPMVETATFLTGADLGTSYNDFAALRDADAEPHVMASTVGGVPLEDLITGFGVVVGTEVALGSIEGLTFALEGFGKVGSGLAREVVRRGGQVVAVSTIGGVVHNPAGLDVELMSQLRGVHGDAFIFQLGGDCQPDPSTLFSLPVDVLVPGARTAVITGDVAATVRARTVSPASNAPYTAEGLAVLKERRISALPDFVNNAGATIGFIHGGNGPGEVFRTVERIITEVMGRAAAWPDGAYQGAVHAATAFLDSWTADVPGPPLP